MKNSSQKSSKQKNLHFFWQNNISKTKEGQFTYSSLKSKTDATNAASENKKNIEIEKTDKNKEKTTSNLKSIQIMQYNKDAEDSNSSISQTDFHESNESPDKNSLKHYSNELKCYLKHSNIEDLDLTEVDDITNDKALESDLEEEDDDDNSLKEFIDDKEYSPNKYDNILIDEEEKNDEIDIEINLNRIKLLTEIINEDIKLLEKAIIKNRNKLQRLSIFCEYSELWVRKTQSNQIYKDMITIFKSWNSKIANQQSETVLLSKYINLFENLWSEKIKNCPSILEAHSKSIRYAIAELLL